MHTHKVQSVWPHACLIVALTASCGERAPKSTTVSPVAVHDEQAQMTTTGSPATAPDEEQAQKTISLIGDDRPSQDPQPTILCDGAPFKLLRVQSTALGRRLVLAPPSRVRSAA